MKENSLLAKANTKFREKKYHEAIELYEEFSKSNPSLKELVASNIQITKRKIASQESRNKAKAESKANGFTQIKPRIAIVVHVYYLNVWDKIKKSLLEIHNDFEYDLIATTTEENRVELHKDLEKHFKKHRLLVVENLGMDVYPFIKTIHEFKLHSYDAVLKLHTKNEKTESRKIQGDITLASLINRDVFESIVDLKNNFFAIFPGTFTRKIDTLMYNNRKLYFQILSEIGCDHKNSGSYFSAGTMFWISGKNLINLYKYFYVVDNIFKSYKGNYISGGDSTPAHAFERVFGSLVRDIDVRLSFRRDKQNLDYQIINAKNSKFLLATTEAGSTDHINLFQQATHLSTSLRKSNYFNDDFYKKEVISEDPNLLITIKDAAVHSILYGSILNLDPSHNFSTSFYKFSNPDILRAGISPVCHYISKGVNEKNRKKYPSGKDLIELIKTSKRLTQKESVINEIDKIIINEATSKEENISTTNYRKIKLLLINALGIKEKLNLCKRLLQNKDYPYLIKAAAELYEEAGGIQEANETMALSNLLNKNFHEAKKFYDLFWQQVTNPEYESNNFYGKMPYDEVEEKLINRVKFEELHPIKNIEYTKKNKICIYTSLYGDFDTLPPILTIADNVDFICFTDKEYPYPTDWDMIIEPGEFKDDNLNAKRFKILPHKYLKAYDASIFVDANTCWYGNIDELINIYLAEQEFAMFAHPCRDDIYKEVATIIAHRRHPPLNIIDQLALYSSDGLPNDSGMLEGSFIWRKHDNVVVNSFMEEWWQHIIKYSKRDQISLGYLVWKSNVKPKILPDYLGTSRDNIYFKKLPHDKNPFVNDTATINKRDTNKTKSSEWEKINIYFVYANDFKNSGSTLMRGFQLCEIIKSNFTKNKDYKKIDKIEMTNSPTLIANSVLFLSKGYLAKTNRDQLRTLQNNGNIILADHVDAKVNSDFVGFFDVLVAASITAYKEYRDKFPNSLSMMLTHHVDPRIEKSTLQSQKQFNKIGYFGEIINTIINEEIEKLVDFHHIDTSGKSTNTDWIYKAPQYKYHYLIRKARDIDGNKPFTKGFTSACCKAYPILSSNVTDAKYYLGHNYPLYIHDEYNNIAPEIEKAPLKRKENELLCDFYLRNLRKRSTNEFICHEFNRILKWVIT